jgi:hypothetical protein
VFHKEPLNLQDAIEEATKNLKAKNLEKQLSLHPGLNGPSRSEFSPLISPKFEESQYYRYSQHQSRDNSRSPHNRYSG